MGTAIALRFTVGLRFGDGVGIDGIGGSRTVLGTRGGA